MVYAEPDSVHLQPPLCLQTDQTACKCPPTGWQVRHIGRMKAQFHSLWAPVALSPSGLSFFHAHFVVFTNRVCYLCFLSLFPLRFNAIGFKCFVKRFQQNVSLLFLRSSGVLQYSMCRREWLMCIAQISDTSVYYHHGNALNLFKLPRLA